MPPNPNIEAVVIGRNEGKRLVSCLQSLIGQVDRVIYVDSGSTDGSPDQARRLGAEVVDLEMSLPFTAARARNAGLAKCRAELVQFVDGDCVMEPGWIKTASAFLLTHPDTAVVCGRRKETHPQASVYNRLCDREWDTPIGETKACGGDALMRTAALTQVSGYRDDLIAGEEPELCVRLRAKGWRIWRLDAPMTQHDAAISRFGQWWTRSTRAGHAFAEGATLHGGPPEHHWVRETRRAVLWGAGLPVGLLLSILWPPFVLGLLAYPAQILRLAYRDRDWAWAVFTVLGKLPECQGVLQFHLSRLRGRKARLFEYK